MSLKNYFRNERRPDRKSTRLNSSHLVISYAVFCLKKNKIMGSPLLSPSGAAKAGLVSLTKSLAVDLGPTGVRLNSVCRGSTATDLNRNLWDDPVSGPATGATVPMHRWGRA